ncbi:LysR family transcriptional regulator [Mycobacterium sp. NPDC050441]|uniref:helix-turn-helix domain-containing protein n=1 Tax=Mycobacterium sp. NPDC050441 TaxID=3155403 RepID=UPI0033E62523
MITLTDTDQIVRSQRMIFDIIDADRAEFGVYRDGPCHARDALRDIKALAVRAFMYANRHGLSAITPPTLVGEGAQHDPPPRRSTRYNSNRANIAPARAVEAAVAITAALNILRERNVADAGEHAAWMDERRVRPCYPKELNTCAQESPLVAAILIKAFAPRRGPCTQLRYKSPLAFPVVPSESQDWLQRLAERVPAVFWPAWAVRLTPADTGSYTLPLALSCAVLLVGTTCNPSDAARLLGHATNGATVGRHLMALQPLPQWNDVCLVLVRVAHYLATHPAPIDYARRRRLDYEDLLTEDRWNEICRETGELPGNGMRRQIARLYLYEKISGLPARTATFMAHTKSTIGFWLRVFNFPAEASAPFASILLGEARQFLSSKGVDEPLVWHPPLTLIHDLTLPGIDLERFGRSDLSRALNEGHTARIGRIARRLNTSTAAVRCLLDVEIDKTSTTAASYHISPHPVRDRLCTELTPAILEDRYVRQGHSLSAIARSFGVWPPLVRKLAEMYGIPLRGRPTRTSDWLFTEYAVKRRTCRDIATEVGVGEVTVRHWIKRVKPDWPPLPAITHRQIGVRTSRALLSPGTMTDLQRRELRHFARALDYPTIHAAADALAISEGNLRKQIHAVERRYGTGLIQRARRGMGQRPTPDGIRLAEAVRVTIGLE